MSREKIKISVTWNNGLTETRETSLKTFMKAVRDIKKQNPKFFDYV